MIRGSFVAQSMCGRVAKTDRVKLGMNSNFFPAHSPPAGKQIAEQHAFYGYAAGRTASGEAVGMTRGGVVVSSTGFASAACRLLNTVELDKRQAIAVGSLPNGIYG